MGAFLVLAAAAFLIYAMVIEPRRIGSIIETRVFAGDLLSGQFSYQEIAELLQAATWIRDKKEVKLSDPGEDDHSGLIEVVCKGVTYQVRIASYGENSSKLTVSGVFKSESWDMERVRRLQEANRIRCRIMERANPGFTEQPQKYYGAIKTLCLLQYCAIALIAAFLCYIAVPQILTWILGAGSVQGIHVLGMMVVVILFIYSGVALSPYIIHTRSEKLLDGVPVPQYWSNDDLMELLRDKLRIRTMQSLYFDETGSVAIKGKHAAYVVRVSAECPRLSIEIQDSSEAAAYQEADYIQCSIAKLFNSTHPENPEAMYQTLAMIRRSSLMAGISVVAFIALLAAPFLLNHFGSRGIANSYLTQYSETVTVGEAFEAFFGDPKWESYKAGAQEYVDFTGKCTYMGENATMRITFAVFDDTFNVSNIAVNGIDMSALLWPGFLEAIYSGAEDAPSAADTPNQGEHTSDVPRPTQPPAGGGEQFPPTLPPVDPNDPNADILSDHLGLYINENGCYLSIWAASGNGYYYGAIYGNRADAENYVNPLLEFSMGGRSFEGTFIFVDSEENTLFLARDSSISDYNTLFLYGDPHYDGVDITPYFDTTFYMVEQYIDVMY
ncbi:MAG: hypothetical protein HDT35_03620 [Clostridiales bacterium]|nr:hypothetical protein [Clostridiales bacterium]